MRTITFLSIISCFMLFSGCNKDEVGIPELQYDDLQRVGVFYQSGSIIPVVHWNGEKGTISLLNTDPLFSIDPDTGELYWGKLKEPNKVYAVTIKAVNSAGESIQELEILNAFSGRFKVESDIRFDTEHYSDKEEYYEFHPGGVLVHQTLFYLKEPFYWEDIYITTSESKDEFGNWDILDSGQIRINTEDSGKGIVYILELSVNNSSDELWLNGSWYDIKEGEGIPDTPGGWAKLNYVAQVRWTPK